MYLCVDKIPTKPSIFLNATDVETMFVLIKLICSQIWPMFCGVQHYTFTRSSGGVILISPPHFPAHLVQTGRHRCRNRILARFRPPHTPSAEHAPTPAHPRTPAHLLDINNPDCYLVKKKSPGPFFLYIERFYLFIYTSYEYVCIHTWIMFAFLIIN